MWSRLKASFMEVYNRSQINKIALWALAIFIVIGVVWYFKYQKKQVKQEQEIKEKIAERELLEKAKKIKEEMANKE